MEYKIASYLRTFQIGWLDFKFNTGVRKMKKGLKITAAVLLSGLLFGLLLGGAALCSYAQWVGFKAMWADFMEVRSGKVKGSESYGLFQIESPSRSEIDRMTAASAAQDSTKGITTLKATVYDQMYNPVGTGESLKKDTLYTISLEDAPECLFDGGVVNISMRYPARMTSDRSYPVEIMMMDEDDGEVYYARVPVRAATSMSLIHGSEDPRTTYGGYFSPNEYNKSLNFSLYTGATEEHLRTHLDRTGSIGVDGTYNVSFERQR